jgi:hypothetical protein
MAEVDLVIRCLEDELAQEMAGQRSNELFVGHYLNLLTTYWIGGMYETFRLLKDRGLADTAGVFAAIFADLELVRVSLEKHEIPKDRSLKEPLTLMPIPGKENEQYSYSSTDKLRAHIMPSGVSQRGSIVWAVIDLKNNQTRLVERRMLSEQMLELWKSG